MNKKEKNILLVIVLVAVVVLSTFILIGMQKKETKGKEELVECGLIALHRDKIVYDYFNDNDEFVIGYYEEGADTLKDIVKIENFYISKGVATVIKDDIYYPMTIYTGEHKILKVNIVEDTESILYSEEDAYGLDVLSTMNNELYQLSGKKLEDGSVIGRIRKYNCTTGEMELLIQKESKNGEGIEGFCCNEGNVYAIVKAGSDIFIEIYDEGGDFQKRVELCEEIKSGLEYGVVHFYVFGEYAYLRDYTDEGMIAKFIDGKLELIYGKYALRFADDSRGDAIINPIFFLRMDETILILNEETGNLEELKLDLSGGERINSVTTDGNKLCISIMELSESDGYETRDIRIVKLDDLR